MSGARRKWDKASQSFTEPSANPVSCDGATDLLGYGDAEPRCGAIPGLLRRDKNAAAGAGFLDDCRRRASSGPGRSSGCRLQGKGLGVVALALGYVEELLAPGKSFNRPPTYVRKRRRDHRRGIQKLRHDNSPDLGRQGFGRKAWCVFPRAAREASLHCHMKGKSGELHISSHFAAGRVFRRKMLEPCSELACTELARACSASRGPRSFANDCAASPMPPRRSTAPRCDSKTSGRQPLTAARAAGSNDLASACGRHARAKPVPTLAHELARLISSLHRPTPFIACLQSMRCPDIRIARQDQQSRALRERQHPGTRPRAPAGGIPPHRSAALVAFLHRIRGQRWAARTYARTSIGRGPLDP